MDSSVSPKDEIWFLRVCRHISNAVYLCFQDSPRSLQYFSQLALLKWRRNIFDNTLPCCVVCIVFTSARSLSSHWPIPSNKFNKQGENYYRFCSEVLRSFPGSVVHRAPPVHTEDTPLPLHPCERDRRLLDGILLIGTSRPCLNAHVWRHQYI
jgi:hypothetical protein